MLLLEIFSRCFWRLCFLDVVDTGDDLGFFGVVGVDKFVRVVWVYMVGFCFVRLLVVLRCVLGWQS
jgi:hypothetical protein